MAEKIHQALLTNNLLVPSNEEQVDEGDQIFESIIVAPAGFITVKLSTNWLTNELKKIADNNFYGEIVKLMMITYLCF
jgi:hypothetical protein